jgi:crotonobetainyl-CoA:carnitine CoA-transferase CaiB-like acyl-CoA transferase
MVTSPAQFDERPNQPLRGPEHGEHTEEVLRECGLTGTEIAELQRTGTIR